MSRSPGSKKAWGSAVTFWHAEGWWILKRYSLFLVFFAVGCGAPDPSDENTDSTQEGVVSRVNWYRAYRGYSGSSGGDHFYSTSLSEVQAAAPGYSYEFVAGTCLNGPLTVNGSTSVKLQRLYNSPQSDHFYTTDPGEASIATQHGYTSENFNQCYVFTTQVPGTCPVYRLWSSDIQDHFYTMSPSERDSAQQRQPAGCVLGCISYTYEKIAGFMYPYNASTCPL